MSKKNDDFFHEKKSWSMIKDELLRCYLIPYFSKILTTRHPTFYVDGFAGKGMFDDGNPGSPVIALEVISDALSKTNGISAPVQACFIELRHVTDLKKNLAQFTRFDNAEVIQGKYADNIYNQLVGKESQNVFLYIDPYGIKSLPFYLFENVAALNFHSIEMLINLNSFGFIRQACNVMNVAFDIPDLDDVLEFDMEKNENSSKSAEALSEIAGGEYWKVIIENYKKKMIDGFEAEKQFSNRYCAKLQTHFKYVLNMPIRLKRNQRPKYRMIHLTNYAPGCVLMNDNMYRRWEALQEMQNQGQTCLFSEDVEHNIINREEVKKKIVDILSKSAFNRELDIEVLCAKCMCEYGIGLTANDICKELEKLCDANKIEVTRTPKFTKLGKPSTFWRNDKGKTVKVRYLQ